LRLWRIWRSEGRVIVSTTAAPVPDAYGSTDKLIFGIDLAVIPFWLFAQTALNVPPTMRGGLRISESLTNTALSITAPKDDRGEGVNG